MFKFIKSVFAVSSFLLFLGWANISTAVVIQIDPGSVVYTAGGLNGSGYGDLTISGSFNLTQVPFSPLPGWEQLIFENIDVVVSAPGFQSPGITSPLPVSALYNGNVFESSLACVLVIGGVCPQDTVTGTFDGSNFNMQRLFFSGIADDYEYQIFISGTAVPVPAAVWLFGSGLIGLFAMAKRRARV